MKDALFFLFYGAMVGGAVGYCIGAYKLSRDHVDLAPLLDAIVDHRNDPETARKQRLAYDTRYDAHQECCQHCGTPEKYSNDGRCMLCRKPL